MTARPHIEAAPGTPNWHAARRGFLTGSRMWAAMDYLKSGKPSQARTDYMMEVVNERLTGIAETHYVTQAMQDGIEREAAALREYDIATGRTPDPGGFVVHPRIEFFGATPDGFIEADGVIEVKAPTRKTYLGWIRDGVVPEQHKPQMIAECVVTGRSWCDFVAYHPDFGERRLFVRRFTPTAEERERVDAEAVKFLADVEAMFEQVLSTQMIED